MISNRHTQGSVLVATVCATTIIGLALATYLFISSQQQRAAARSLVWNSCLPVAEAGVEEALTHCFLNYSNLVSEGWAYTSSRQSLARTRVFPDSYYEVEFTTNTPHVITSRGYVRLASATNYISRTLRVVNHQNIIFKYPINVRGKVDFNGNNVKADSFDSRDPRKSTGFRYDPNKAGDKGDIVCDELTPNVGNANIWGHVYTRPQATAPYVGPLGAVGNTNWQRSGQSGIQSGWWVTTTNVATYVPVKAPFTTGLSPSKGNVGGVYYDQIFDKKDGQYVVGGLAGKTYIGAKVVVYSIGSVGGSFTVRNDAGIKLYVRGSTVSINTIDNPNNYAGSFIIYGLPSCVNFSIGGNRNLTCAAYAPHANFKLNGSAEMSGAVVCNNFTMVGNTEFHFDEALARDPDLMIFEIQSWEEL